MQVPERSLLGTLSLLGPDWNDEMGTMSPAAAGSPHNRLCSGIATLIDSEKLKDIARDWKIKGLPDTEDSNIAQ